MSSNTSQQHSEASDIFSLSDQVLSERLQFVTEIGFGNWGSVWLCRPRCNPASPYADVQVAVKVVHRLSELSEAKATTARVRSLWNEMKIIRSFKNDPHPSIIPFHSFIITPSYALITMVYLPTLIPVEVEEIKAKPWFRSLLSAIEFLHVRGIVHNDIKPANILLNERRVPVFVDFGFAEKYDLKSSKAFRSNLMYGTPEYLSPERARGLQHDTRKSDLWSLGITFFEILIGRTPFEHASGEEFLTQADTERYWRRTLRGRWVGTWKISVGMEKLLRRMMAPTADLRCNAADAMADSYWSERSSSASHTPSQSVTAAKEMSKLMDVALPWSPRSTSKNRNKENFALPTKNNKTNSIFGTGTHSRSVSQPIVKTPKPALQPKKRHAIPPLATFSPVKPSRQVPPKPHVVTGGDSKENSDTRVNFISFNNITSGTAARNAFGGSTRQPLSAVSQNLPLAPTNTAKANGRGTANRKNAFKDITGLNNRSIGQPAMIVKEKPKPLPKVKEADMSVKEQDSVRKRVNEWERERERLREMERLELFEKDAEWVSKDEDLGDVSSATVSSPSSSPERGEKIHFAKVAVRAVAQIVPSTPALLELSTTSDLGPPASLSTLKQSLKLSIDKGIRIYKSSTLGQTTGCSTPGPSLPVEGVDQPDWNVDVSERLVGKDDVIPGAPSPLPQTVRNERIAEDPKLDRMTSWIRNVDKVVEDARQKFDSASAGVPQTPLPIPPPISRSVSQMHASRSSSRLPRKVLTANQIFGDQNTSISASVDIDPSNVDKTLPPIPSEDMNHVDDFLATSTPRRLRRATITTRSPDSALKKQVSFDIDTGSPSKRKGKSKSQGNLLRPIQTIERLELELQKEEAPPQSPRLSAFLDKSLFIAPPIARSEDESGANTDNTILRSRSLDFDRTTSPPAHVEPCSPCKTDRVPQITIETPNRSRIDGVYDRFLMATTGVKRAGRGYQSDNFSPSQSTPDPATSPHYHKRSGNYRIFNITRPTPPPVSSEDLRAVGEFGSVTGKIGANTSHCKDDSNDTVAFVRRAFKAVVTGKTPTRRPSRTIVP